MAEIGRDLALAAQLLETGEVVAVPTETVYGLAANALDPSAVVKIFRVKRRPLFNPLIVHIPNANVLSKYVDSIPPLVERIMAEYSPGPITYLLSKNDIIPDIVSSGLPNVAIRIPSHPLMRKLLESLSFPLAAPSANTFGYISPTSAMHVQHQLGNEIPYIIDGGKSGIGIESTIISEADGKIIVHRLGGLSIEDIEKVAGKVELVITSSSNPKSPGQLDSHYAPRKPLFLKENIKISRNRNSVGYLTFGKTPIYNYHLDLSPDRNPSEAAIHLFAYMRALDAMPDIAYIEAELLPEDGLGRAINDRLRRAATYL